MKLTPDDETSIPSREAFYGVGSSRTSLCPSPEDANVAIHVEKDDSGDADIEKVTRKHSNDELHRIPLSGMVCDSEKTRNGMVDADHQQKCDHHDGDVDIVVVSSQNKGDNDINERRIGLENAEGTKKHEERLSTDNNVDVDVDVECHDPRVKDDVVDDPDRNSILESKLTFEQQDENDDGYGDPSLSRPPTKPGPTDSPSSIQCSVYVSGDLRSSSQLPQSRENGEPSQQGSARSLRSSRSKRQGKSNRRSSGASKRTIRSERSSSSSSLLSKSSSGSSSASSSGSTTGSDSSSSSSCSNSDSESYSSSGSSSCSSSDSSSCSSCNESSDGESSDSEPSASGSESESSSNDEADSADVRYHISAEKNRRTSRRDSGPSSSFSFAPEEHASLRTDMKLREKRWQTRHARKPSYSTIPQRRRYDETDGIVHQETCSTVCVIL